MVLALVLVLLVYSLTISTLLPSRLLFWLSPIYPWPPWPPCSQPSPTIGPTAPYLIGPCPWPNRPHHRQVLETRKGRCGEYSMLVFRMLEMLGYRTRWTVDWADHVSVTVSERVGDVVIVYLNAPCS